jgi:hypothetical protein
MMVVALLLSISLAGAAADFSINTFSCSPSETVINEVFSCTAQIKNVGDAAGSVNEVRLYSDSGNWLESSNYIQNSGTSVSPGQTTEVTFSGMRATKAGNNGFLRITLDNQADTWVADNNVKENVIDVSVRTTNSISSGASGDTFTVTPEVTAGGNIDSTLTFTVEGGGCSIGSQSATKSNTGLLDQQIWTPSAWTVTMGSSGDCRYTVSAAATGSNGVASTTTSVSKTVACTSSDCVTASSSSSSGGGGGGGGGSSPSLGELKTAMSYELAASGAVIFSFGGVNHTFSVLSITETQATITIKSDPQTFVFTVGEEKNIDLDGDGKNDISVKLKSINIINKKANFIFTPLYAPSIISGRAVDTPKASEQKRADSGQATASGSDTGGLIGAEGSSSSSDSWLKLIGILVIVALVVIGAYYYWRNNGESRLINAVRMKHFTPERIDYKKSK